MLGLMAKLIFWDLENGEVAPEEKDYNDIKDGGDGYDVDEGFQKWIKAEGRDPIVSTYFTFLFCAFMWFPILIRIGMHYAFARCK